MQKLFSNLSIKWHLRSMQSARNASSLQEFKSYLSEQLTGIKAAGTYKNERVILTKQSSYIRVANNENKQILNFCANNYLGLSVKKIIFFKAYI